MKKLKFNNGDLMPAIGLGTWKLRNHEVRETLMSALMVGYTHIDCAWIYANEAEIGEILKEACKKGIVKRENLWITSKLWNDAHRPEDVLPAIKDSLYNLKIDYLDLYLMHWPVAFKKGVDVPAGPQDFYDIKDIPVEETWEAMEEAVKSGMVRHLGVSNFNESRLRILHNKSVIKPELNQVELHPYLPQKELLTAARELNIHLTAYSPLGSRDRSDKMKKSDEPDLFADPVIRDIAEKYDSHPARILIAWAVQRGTAVIPKSTNPDHLKDNLAAADLHLEDEDVKKLSNLSSHYRFVDGKFWEREGAPFSAEELW